MVSIAKIESCLVVVREADRLFLVGWDVPAFRERLPVLSGVRR
jgi:hypothetical protein